MVGCVLYMSEKFTRDWDISTSYYKHHNVRTFFPNICASLVPIRSTRSCNTLCGTIESWIIDSLEIPPSSAARVRVTVELLGVDDTDYQKLVIRFTERRQALLDKIGEALIAENDREGIFQR